MKQKGIRLSEPESTVKQNFSRIFLFTAAAFQLTTANLRSSRTLRRLLQEARPTSAAVPDGHTLHPDIRFL